MTGGSVFDDTASQQLEAVYVTPDIVRQRSAILARLNLQPGETVLDVGSGPGLLMADIAEVVGPQGRVVGVDVSDPMLKLSNRRFATRPGPSRPVVLKADATALPFATGSFDAATSAQVYEYVPDVDQGLRELWRMLRPGGRALVLDTDWDSVVWNTTDPALTERVLHAWVQRFAHPHLPRTLRRRLQAVGFQDVECEALVLLNPVYDPNTYSITNAEIMSAFVLKHGVPPSDVEGWRNALSSTAEKGDYFFSLNRYLFLARKPPRPHSSLAWPSQRTLS